MKRVSVPDANKLKARKDSKPSDCHALRDLFNHLWRTFLKPALSDDPDAAHAFALMQHRIKELIERGPEGIACATYLLAGNIKQASTSIGASQMALRAFERRIAETFKGEVKIKLKATRKRTGSQSADCSVLEDLFDYLWRVFLQPNISKDPSAVYAFAIMQHRIGETIECGPEGAECATTLLTMNIKRAFKYTKAHKKHKISFEVYERYLDGNDSPEDGLEMI